MRYIILDLVEATIREVETSEFLLAEKNQIIYHENVLLDGLLKNLEDPVIIKISEIKELYDKTKELVEEKSQAGFHKALFTKADIQENEIFIPCEGAYYSSEQFYELREKSSHHDLYVGETGRRGKENVEVYIAADHNTSISHSAKHLPANELLEETNPTLAMANLIPLIRYLKIQHAGKVKYLPLAVLRNDRPLEKASILGYDYGASYWAVLKKGYLRFNRKGEIIERVALLEFDISTEESVTVEMPESYNYEMVGIICEKIENKEEAFFLFIFSEGQKQAIFNTPSFYSYPSGLIVEAAFLGAPRIESKMDENGRISTRIVDILPITSSMVHPVKMNRSYVITISSATVHSSIISHLIDFLLKNQINWVVKQGKNYFEFFRESEVHKDVHKDEIEQISLYPEDFKNRPDLLESFARVLNLPGIHFIPEFYQNCTLNENDSVGSNVTPTFFRRTSSILNADDSLMPNNEREPLLRDDENNSRFPSCSVF